MATAGRLLQSDSNLKRVLVKAAAAGVHSVGETGDKTAGSCGWESKPVIESQVPEGGTVFRSAGKQLLSLPALDPRALLPPPPRAPLRWPSMVETPPVEAPMPAAAAAMVQQQLSDLEQLRISRLLVSRLSTAA